MKIKYLTITGADNQTPIKKMVSLSEAFPILEWGILISKKSFGKISYPDLEWLDLLSSASSVIKISVKDIKITFVYTNIACT